MRHTSCFNLCKGYLAISKLAVHQNARGQEHSLPKNAPKPSCADFQVVNAELLLEPLWLTLLNFTFDLKLTFWTSIAIVETMFNYVKDKKII